MGTGGAPIELQGLTSHEVSNRQATYGPNTLELRHSSALRTLLRQFDSPLLLILMVTIALAYWFDSRTESGIIAAILLVGVTLGFINELASERTVSSLLGHISLSAVVVRNGEKQDIPVADVTIGDTVLLHQGTVVPADVRLLSTVNLSIDESALTGESLPVSKKVGKGESGQAAMGTVVMSGSGVAEVVAIGKGTQVGTISLTLNSHHPKTAFQRGLADLSKMMSEVITGMALLIGVLNVAIGRSPIEALLFALAIAIGLTPSLLPVILTVSMSQGARRLSKRGVIVKHLASIENLGNLEVLCTDKTGTLTEGKITVECVCGVDAQPSDEVLEAALLCNTATVHHRVYGNPIDVAIWEHALSTNVRPSPAYHLIYQEEFNYEYRGQIAIVEKGGELSIFFKGAADATLSRCSKYRTASGKSVAFTEAEREKIVERLHALNREGLRVTVVASRLVGEQASYHFADAHGLELLGYIAFLDTPRHSAKHAIDQLGQLGVAVKIVTGDNARVTQRICQELGITVVGVLTGKQLERLSAKSLAARVNETTIFAEVSPAQKAQIVQALQRAGKVVGYLGDGVNDTEALHMADVSLSVNSAVDVAKEVASIVLLRKGLDVIAEGVREGRRTFTNTITYILMGTSSNFGNMFSMAGASLILPFLPMTPSQILLNNSLYDVAQLGLPSDEVDSEMLARPARWNVKGLYRAMICFGPISSIFDYIMFAVLWFGFHATEHLFQSGWFIFSLVSQVFVVFVIRTVRTPFWKSRPGRLLVVFSVSVVVLAGLILVSPLAPLLELTPLPLPLVGVLALIAFTYITLVEVVKLHFFRRVLR